MAVGPSGFLYPNSSTQAAFALADIYLESGFPGVALLVLTRARMHYTKVESDYEKIAKAVKEIKVVTPPKMLAKWRQEAVSSGWRWARFE